MQIEFRKLHGAGNDFVFIEDLDDQLELSEEQVAWLCDRHFGIGADGVIVVKPPKDAANDGFMHYINSDGSLAQMCGNGVRCFAKYLVDYGVVPAGKQELLVETRAGVKRITYTLGEDGKLATATVDMGEPILPPQLVPSMLPATATTSFGKPYAREVPIESPYGTHKFTLVSMGNPHAVTFVDDVDAVDIDAVGAYYERCSAFPQKANIEFAQVTEQGIRMRVFERGCGETLACGTGACATGVAAWLTERAGTSNDLLLRGGTLHIDYTPGGNVMMTGPAAESFHGTVEIPEL